MDAGITAQAVLAVVTPFLGIVALRIYATLVAGEEREASLGLVGVDSVVGVPVTHYFRIVTIAIFVEICGVRFDATSADDHIRIILQDLEILVPSLGLPCQFEVQNDAVTDRQVGDALCEFVERIDRNFNAVRQPAC